MAVLPRDQVMFLYKRHLGGLAASLAEYKDTYGEAFDPNDPSIPEAFKHFFALIGIRSVMSDADLIEMDRANNEVAPNVAKQLSEFFGKRET